MGWCLAFGPQIQEGCDHAMVAGRDSCSCPDCGTVCQGLFPGCASVWAAGPRMVTLTRPPKGSDLLPVPVRPTVSAARAMSGIDAPTDPSDIRELRNDVHLLLRKMDQLQQAAIPGDRIVRAAEEIGAVAAGLPDQLREAVKSALELQRRAMSKVFADIERKVMADISQMQENLRQESPQAGGQAASLADLDVRFRWLVQAVSERFVTLGNEVAKIDRHLADRDIGNPTTNGGSGGGVSNGGVSNGGINGAKTRAPAGDNLRS